VKFAFDAVDLEFQRELHELLVREVPDWYTGIFVLNEEDHHRAWDWANGFARRLAKAGMLVSGWPSEYGGADASPLRQLILAEEMQYFDEPRGAHYMGANWVGPALIRFGSPEQRREFLPQVASASIIWCQGFSEPNAGSDLASLETAAVADGDDFVINGTKIWTSYADQADYCVLGARTDPAAPKHRGITYFIVDMHAPGVRPEPIDSLFGKHFCQVWYEDVRVPRSRVLGEVNGGWALMAGSLEVERAGTLSYSECLRRLDEVAALLRQWGRKPSPEGLGPRFAQAYTEVEVARWVARNVYWRRSQGMSIDYEPSEAKLFLSEVYQRTAAFLMSVLGIYGELERHSPLAPLNGRIERMYLWSLETSVAGGTSEVQRNVIAQRGLGLPR
jgi:alkylation response protein AidB-like acyl-CoA dehydrogenase